MDSAEAVYVDVELRKGSNTITLLNENGWAPNIAGIGISKTLAVTQEQQTGNNETPKPVDTSNNSTTNAGGSETDTTNHTGTQSKSTKVTLSATKIKNLKSKKAGQITVTYKKNEKATGYQIQYSTSKAFKSAKNVKISKNKTVTRTIKGLKKGKKYYVRVRCYKKVNGKTIYSKWSTKKTVKVKKK